MADGYIGEIRMIANNFAPKGWAVCDGKLQTIASNAALFSILGTSYGGDGRTTFGLPDLRGRAPVAATTGTPAPGLTPYAVGQGGGAQNVTLISLQMPAHTHAMQGSATLGNVSDPNNNYLASGSGARGGGTYYYAASGTAVSMSPNAMSTAGSGGPHNNCQPYLGIMFIICTDGIFPPRPS